MFGKAVRLRHYPVTVIAEILDLEQCSGHWVTPGRLFRVAEA
jgi:hypothetical protein